MPINTPLTICILNGYPRASRDNFDLAGVGHPHDLFKNFLSRYVPGATVDVLFVADGPNGESLPQACGYACGRVMGQGQRQRCAKDPSAIHREGRQQVEEPDNEIEYRKLLHEADFAL